MDTARTPKRRRRWPNSSTSKRARKRTSTSSSIDRTPVSGGKESKIVWKDSPADKQIKVSGTGKMAVRREMQGFVGRLARASQQSPPSHSKDDENQSQERGHTHRKTVQLGEKKAENLKNIISKTGDVRERTSSFTQDELFDVLDQMEEKYASPDGVASRLSLRVKMPQDQHSQQALKTAEALDLTQNGNLMSTLSSSNSSTGTLSPRSLRTQEASKTQERPRNQEVVKALISINEEEPVSKKKVFVIDSDPFDDLTDESWALLDQLQSQRAQTEANIVLPQSKTEIVSPQNLALTPRPMPSAAHKMMKKTLSPVPFLNDAVSEVRSQEGITSALQLVEPESYKRFLVLEVDRKDENRSLLLRLLDDQDVQNEAILRDDWYDSIIDAGDTINIVFTEQDKDGFYSQDGIGMPVDSQQILVDNAHNIVVVHPDILVSPTRVTTSFGCLRRAVLQETLAVSRPTNKKAFWGTLKHELFEFALLHGLDSSESFLEAAKRIITSNILGLVECEVNEEDALLELKKVIEEFRSWISAAIVGSGTPLNVDSSNNRTKVHVDRVISTEEMVWSIKWGLKGATDASVEGTILVSGSCERQEKTVFPVELKTGIKTTMGDHQGQVLLYTLLLNERYRQRCQDGLLIYVPPIQTNRIAAVTTHVRGLIMTRNHFASAVARVKSIGGSSSTQVYPSMIRNRRDCERCFQIDECVLHHAATENGTEKSSGLDDLFTLKTQHLGEEDLNYFKQWIRLIELEQQHAEKNLRSLWLQIGWKREQAHASSTCLAHLKLVSDTPAPSNSGGKRILRFVRDRRKRCDTGPRNNSKLSTQLQPTSFAGVHFRADERVILSVESLDGKRMLLHVSRATVRQVEHGLITIESRQNIPSIVKSGHSVVGKEYTWRLDKDTILSGLQRAKENLVRLFIGIPPEAITSGTNVAKRPELQVRLASAIQLNSHDNDEDSASGAGDSRRRNLIIHLTRPQFKVSRITDLITQRCQDSSTNLPSISVAAHGQLLLDAFYALNIDQQQAVQRVLNSLDYALILGMPGTGKTATIAFTVRVLLFLGFSVLVTSYTHSAVDNLLLKLLAYELPILRIGDSAQVHPKIAAFTLTRQAEQEKIVSVRAMESKMMNAQLVGCTCLSVNSHVLFAKRRFDFCIVDEATQITQPIVLGPLRCADTFVLVGDHYQLPPLVANAQARKEGMDVSLFRKLAEAHPEATQQLSYQYRMNRDIMLLANRLVYGDKLKCGSYKVASNHLTLRWQQRDISGLKYMWPMQILSNNRGVVFLDTDAMGEVTKESSSAVQLRPNSRRRMENIVESQIIAGLVELLVLGCVPPDEIAVISPFRSQVALIQQHLKTVCSFQRANRHDLVHSIEVSTIDKYQGKDKSVILVSFVRSNEEKHVGELLTDWRRINVALTRAKQKLILVGSKSTLSGGSALFHVLSKVIQEQQWGYKLPRDAIQILKTVLGSFAAVEPESERDTSPESKLGDNVECSILKRSAANGNDDIEALVPDISSVSHRSRQRTRSSQMKPILRDIFGEM
ncbi:dna replication helicase dna2 [Plasmopara halstedii]|uniref:DNA replication ATP-dependent helicase/nuclease DNA2 n=1 Tax=Plasmopara halstedii TaxID=4781 RepID=A0A0P1B3G7_PLAHL|nr:dna replication helicase dna2 [Plasmopara halstedii]CEG48498.1 dna replication helicase dna2 [Plasmopara halstedii]|eukprot:XP_024584867.1 dna replication helicase dna2 [Plasmopara halstedii]